MLRPSFTERLHVVGEAQRRRIDDEQPVALGLPVNFGGFEVPSRTVRAIRTVRVIRQPIAIDDHLGGVVFELAVVLPFEADERFGDDADAPTVALMTMTGFMPGWVASCGKVDIGVSFARVIFHVVVSIHEPSPPWPQTSRYAPSWSFSCGYTVTGWRHASGAFAAMAVGSRAASAAGPRFQIAVRQGSFHRGRSALRAAMALRSFGRCRSVVRPILTLKGYRRSQPLTGHAARAAHIAATGTAPESPFRRSGSRLRWAWATYWSAGRAPRRSYLMAGAESAQA